MRATAKTAATGSGRRTDAVASADAPGWPRSDGTAFVQTGARALSAVTLVALSMLPPKTMAQPWRGNVALAGNYYWENSTRVIAPEVTGVLAAPDGTRLTTHYLVDAITSASVAAGARSDTRFTELRHDASLGVGHEWDIGGTPLDLAVSGRVSVEPDYTSVGATAAATLALNARSTVLSFRAAYTHDLVGQVLRGLNRVDPETGRDLSDRGTVGELDGLVLSASVGQALSPNLLVSFGYDLGLLFGYLQNPYRQVPVAGVLVAESHPSFRHRHSAYGEAAYAVATTGTTFRLLYRAYLDSWEIGALEPELRLYQTIGGLLTLRLRYRYYAQTRAYFQASSYTLADRYWTADPKMTAFESHLVGALARLELAFLEDTFLDFAEDAVVSVSFDYLTRTNSFGNGLMGQASITLPF